MNLDDAITEWCAARASMGYPKSTVKAGEQAMKLFLTVVGNVQVRNLGAHHGEMYLAYLRGRGNSPATINQRLSLARSFVDWARHRKYLRGNTNPLATVRGQKIEDRPRRRVPVHEFPRLLDAAETTGGPQARIIVALGLYLFLRTSEIEDLRIRDVDLALGEVRVFQRKTTRWDTMPISVELDEEIRRWLTWYTEDQAAPLEEEWRFVPARRKHFIHDTLPGRVLNPGRRIGHTSHKIHAALRELGWEVSGEDAEGVHTLRRSGARAWFDDLTGRDDPAARDDALRKVAAMLHHRTITTTERYLGLDVDRERRDSLVRGERMFTTTDRANVVQIRRDA